MLDASEKQIWRNGARDMGECLSVYRSELRRAGLPRLLTALLVLRQFDVLTRQQIQFPAIHISSLGDNDDE